MVYDVIIIGSGPAGLTAAIYSTRANLKTLVVAGGQWGGQLMFTTLVENYPGFPEGIQGPDLMMNMRKQAERFGAEFIDENLVSADFSSNPFTITTESNRKEQAQTVLIATGADAKTIGLPNERALTGKGVSYCGTCDAAFFRNKNVIVVGGGDTAMEDATFLTRFANSVTIVHRRDTLKASKVMQDRAKANPKISFIWDTEVTEIQGTEKVTGVTLKNVKTGQTSQKETDGVFVAIGHVPNTMKLQGIEIDEQGYVVPHNRTRTNVKGVFVAGDVHDHHYKQAITAAGFGCMAALDIERYLSGEPEDITI